MRPMDPDTRLILTIAYDGSRFYGSQLQQDVVTVQGTLEHALRRATPTPPRVLFAGRTDRGVHATGQVILIRPQTLPPPEATARMLDARVAPAIRVVSWTTARSHFDPRHRALWREYRYVIWRTPGCSPFREPYGLFVPEVNDWNPVQRAIEHFMGSHDFTAFTTVPSQQERLRRTIDEAEVHVGANRIVIRFRARSFLRGQVRNMVGALLAVGRGHLGEHDIACLLRSAHKDRVPPPAPPTGLYLTKVHYDENCLDHSFCPLHGSHKALDDHVEPW